MARPGEADAVRTTIVGGRPPGGGANVGDVPRGVEVLIKKAAVDPKFKKILLQKRAGAAEAIALKLEPAEAAMFNAIPEAQLKAIVANTKVSPSLQPAFLGYAAGVMLAALGTATACGGADVSPDITRGIEPDIPPVIPDPAETPKTDEKDEDIVLPADTGIVECIVYDQNRDPISGTKVKIVRTKYEAITGSAGKFRFIAVPVGKYEIKASRIGFSSAKRTNIEVTEGGITTATFMLQSMPAGGIYHDRP
ncbi:MAG: carboxypeptidase-like regulatory domain-containing protein, partial [bacterium]